MTSSNAAESICAEAEAKNESVIDSTAEKNSIEKQINSMARPLFSIEDDMEEKISYRQFGASLLNVESVSLKIVSLEKIPSISEASRTEKYIKNPAFFEPSIADPTAPTAKEGEGRTAKRSSFLKSAEEISLCSKSLRAVNAPRG